MKILLMEDPIVIPTVVSVLNHIDRADKINFEIMFAPSATEARVKITDADMAIIGIEFEGRALAEYALNGIGIPVIAMSTQPHDWSSIRETENLRFIAKPSFPLTKLAQSIRDFVQIIQKGKSKKQVAESFAKHINQTLSKQIAKWN